MAASIGYQAFQDSDTSFQVGHAIAWPPISIGRLMSRWA